MCMTLRSGFSGQSLNSTHWPEVIDGTDEVRTPEVDQIDSDRFKPEISEPSVIIEGENRPPQKPEMPVPGSLPETQIVPLEIEKPQINPGVVIEQIRRDIAENDDTAPNTTWVPHNPSRDDKGRPYAN